MSIDAFRTDLACGLPVTVRPLTQRDRGALAEGYRRLSPDSRYQRFWVHTGEVMGEKMLDRILRQDPENHAVWAVLDPTREFPGIGAASFWRSENDPEEAEFSCTVLDGDQRRGIGTLLLATVWLAAFRVGIRRFTGYTMPENVSAIRWMRDTGAEAEWDGYKVIFRWRLDDLQPIPATPAGAALAERLSELAPKLLPD
ncbi:GNAT family N-acetyltransferase [Haloferula rosea]|uniref:GNAT family N-acetyltransferase n=1 Tax=Haloferula rosea TaxID=490093 RepID=A0A934RCL1_9BACT|nr:GNAT family N-acetyltransferase [Haloferula rosea]MBK1826131.1 GNAT family N-acetyltransferase [Haloferula rosea]